MIDLSAVTLVVLGGGLATRFGSDKLAAELGGRPLSQYLLATVTPLPFSRRLLVARGQSWTQAYAKAQFTVLDNPRPELGPGASLAIALANVDSPALLVCLADMPLVTASHLMRLVEAYNASFEAIASVSGGYRGPPAVFPRRLLETADLASRGARSLLAQAAAVAGPPHEFQDIDTLEDLARLSFSSTYVPKGR